MISIEEAISHSERRANRLWLISILWVLVMLVVAATFGISIYQFDQTKDELLTLHKQVAEQQQRAEQLIAQLEKMKQAVSILEKKMLDKLGAHEAWIHVLTLQTIRPQDLTPAQKDFIKQQANRTSDTESAPEKLVVQAFSELLERRYQQSYEIYSQALLANPDFADAYAGRAMADFGLGNASRAYDDLTKALQFDKDETHQADLLIRRADYLVYLGRINEAELDLAEASKQASKTGNPKDAGYVANERGLIAVLKKDWNDAEKDFKDAAKLLPGQGIPENIGLIYLAQSDWNRAYNWTVEISAISEALEWNWMIKALAAKRLGKTQERDEAIKGFMKNNRDPKYTLASLKTFLPNDLARLAENWIEQPQK